jgi:hypothetical protein
MLFKYRLVKRGDGMALEEVPGPLAVESEQSLEEKIYRLGGRVIALQEHRRDQQALITGLLVTVDGLKKRVEWLERQSGTFGHTSDGTEVPPFPKPPTNPDRADAVEASPSDA